MSKLECDGRCLNCDLKQITDENKNILRRCRPNENTQECENESCEVDEQQGCRVIYITTECNLACEYCYEKRKKFKMKSNKSFVISWSGVRLSSPAPICFLGD